MKNSEPQVEMPCREEAEDLIIKWKENQYMQIFMYETESLSTARINKATDVQYMSAIECKNLSMVNM